MLISVGARSSKLSKAQCKEVEQEIQAFDSSICFVPTWIETTGDLDKKTSLKRLDKTDFFTKELDEALLNGHIQIAIHSAKDLPDPLAKGLKIFALTRGVDPRDSLVLSKGETLASLRKGALIATSSERREQAIQRLRPDLTFTDLRGHIEERLSLLEKKAIDGLVIAEAALIRLQWTHLNRVILDTETTPFQGRLAVVGREGELELEQLFKKIHDENALPRT